MDLGDFELDAVSDGTFALDGGAMFGVVPKAIWQEKIPADSMNRIKLGLNCLLIRGGKEGKNILVDTGIGDKFNDKLKQRYAVEKSKASPGVAGALKNLGMSVKEIDYVILSHLHFDHAGGNTVFEGRKAVPLFQNAKYIVQKKEWEDALNPNERSKASYIPDNYLPLEDAGNLKLINGNKEIVKGVKTKVTGGHTAGHQIVIVDSLGKGAVYFGDIIPTTAHLGLPYITGYDLWPLETIKVKKGLIHSAVSNHTLCFFEHDSNTAYGYLKESSGKIEVINNG